MSDVFDVAICGGGLAGLSLARQISTELPGTSVLLVDRLKRPLPEAAFKVGESLTEAGAFYLKQIASPEYMADNHPQKLGLRYFSGSGSEALGQRSELGLSMYPGISSFQIDRGVIENDFRGALDSAPGVTLLEGWDVVDVGIDEPAFDARHHVRLRNIETGDEKIAGANWVIDASGRRRLINRKLGLHKDFGRPCSSVWFRYDDVLNINDMVPKDDESFHSRVVENRYNSTNHLCGPGYWVWFIPLSHGATSIGIVFLEDFQDFESVSTFERALNWLKQNEPGVAQYLAGREKLDFRAQRRYSYSTTKMLSSTGWACTGEAALFSDPLYSPGTEFIALCNNTIINSMRLEKAGSLTEATTDYLSRYLIALSESIMLNIQATYDVFHRPPALAAKLFWDTGTAWSFLAPQIFNPVTLSPEPISALREARATFFFLSSKMRSLFKEWAARSQGRLTYDFINYLDVARLKELRFQNLQEGKSLDELIDDHRNSLEFLEELAQVIFLLALEDTDSPRAADPGPSSWFNAWAVGLDESRWEKDGLFRPRTSARDLRPLYENVRGLFDRQLAQVK